MVWPILSATLSLVPVAPTHSVTPGGLIFVAIPSFGTGINGMVLGHFVTIVLTLACLGEPAIWVCPMRTVVGCKFSSERGHLFD